MTETDSVSPACENLEAAAVQYGAKQICDPAPVRRAQDTHEQIRRARRWGVSLGAVLASRAIRVRERARDLAQAALMAVAGDPATEKLPVPPAPHRGRLAGPA